MSLTVADLLQQTFSDERTIRACFEQSRQPDDEPYDQLAPIFIRLLSARQLRLVAKTIGLID